MPIILSVITSSTFTRALFTKTNHFERKKYPLRVERKSMLSTPILFLLNVSTALKGTSFYIFIISNLEANELGGGGGVSVK